MPAEILLVHGSMLGAWCWQDTIAELAALGTDAAAFDLPGHGDDATPRGSVTVADYVAAVVDHLDQASGPVVLAGHSMAGYPIAAAALQRPDKVRHLVYFSAQARKPGQSWRTPWTPSSARPTSGKPRSAGTAATWSPRGWWPPAGSPRWSRTAP